MITNRVTTVLLSVALLGTVVACGGGGSRKGDGQASPNQAAERGGVVPPQEAKRSAGPVVAAPQKLDVQEEASAAERAAEARAKARAQAEADAEAKDRANRKAYDAEVERLKADHQKAVEKFRADKEAFDKESAAYGKAKAEYDAARKLALARTLYDESKEKAAKERRREAEKLMDLAQPRLQEVIKLYPNTQAAKDAKGLLSDRPVTARKVPPAPVPPDAPVEPVLKLPPPPVPATVVYLPEPEEIAAAQAKAEADRKAQADARAEAERRRKAEEEYDADGLVLMLKTVKARTTEFSYEVTGTVVNRRGRKVNYAQITFAVYDKSGGRVGTALANINGLEPGDRWNFKAIAIVSNGRESKLSELTGR